MRSKAFYERPWCPVRNPRGGGQANRWSSESRPPFLWPARTAGTDALLPRPRVVASRNSKLAVTMSLGSPRHPTSRPYGTGSDHSVALVYRRLETNWWAVRVAQDAF